MLPVLLTRASRRRFARVLATDSFTRTVAAGSPLGVTDNGLTWTGGTTNVSIDGTQLVLALSASQTRPYVLSQSLADSDQRIDFETPALPASGTNTISLVARYTDGTHHYRLRATVDSAGLLRVVASYINGGSETLIGSQVSVATIAVGDRWCLRGRIVGTRLQVKAWAAATAEPSTWNYDQTDATHAGPADIGMRFAAGAAAMSLYVDNYIARAGTGIIPLRAAGLGDQLFYVLDSSGNHVTTGAGDRIKGAY
jgi:hypothetical protein